jgi:rare lipoprotein A
MNYLNKTSFRLLTSLRVRNLVLFTSCLYLCSCARKITETGKASFYADKFEGRKTASGEVFKQGKLTAAHRTLPFGTKVKVVNLANGRSVNVTVNDRGPFVAGRMIDLSKKAANKIGMVGAGVASVQIRYKRKKQ